MKYILCLSLFLSTLSLEAYSTGSSHSRVAKTVAVVVASQNEAKENVDQVAEGE